MVRAVSVASIVSRPADQRVVGEYSKRGMHSKHSKYSRPTSESKSKSKLAAPAPFCCGCACACAASMSESRSAAAAVNLPRSSLACGPGMLTGVRKLPLALVVLGSPPLLLPLPLVRWLGELGELGELWLLLSVEPWTTQQSVRSKQARTATASRRRSATSAREIAPPLAATRAQMWADAVHAAKSAAAATRRTCADSALSRLRRRISPSSSEKTWIIKGRRRCMRGATGCTGVHGVHGVHGGALQEGVQWCNGGC